MIDKRVSYRFGGAMESRYGGGDKGSSGSSSGSSSDDERYQAAQAALKAEADRRQKAEQAARDREQAAIQQYTRPEPEDARGVDLHQGPTVKEVLDKVAADKREQEPIKSL